MSRVRIVALLILAPFILGALAYIAGVRTYGTPGRTLNGGITAGSCGVEVWGTSGPFCNSD